MLKYDCPECEVSCDDYVLPAVQSEYCPATMTLELAEIKRILLAEVDATTKEAVGAPADWLDDTLWDAAIDNATSNTIKSLYGIGDVAEPEGKVVTVHDGQEVNLEDTYTLVFDVQDTNATNYTAARSLSACKGRYFLWYETRGNFLYGGQSGIPVNLVRVTSPNERGADAYKVIKFYFKWIASCLPERAASPFADAAVPTP